MKRIAEVAGCQLRLLDVTTIRFVDYDAIRHFHDTTLDALKLIAGASQLDEQEKIDHGVNSGFALSYPYGFHKNLIESGCLA